MNYEAAKESMLYNLRELSDGVRQEVAKQLDVHFKDAVELATLLIYDDRNSLESWENTAAAFYKDTGILRPGKDYASHGGPPPSDEVRQQRFREWFNQKCYEFHDG